MMALMLTRRLIMLVTISVEFADAAADDDVHPCVNDADDGDDAG